MDIWDNYLSGLDVSQRNAVLKAGAIIKKIEPNIEVGLPYGVPGYKYNGKNLIAFAAHKNHFGVYPFSPAIVKEMVKDNPGISFAEGTLRFKYSDLPNKDLIKQIIKFRKNEIS